MGLGLLVVVAAVDAAAEMHFSDYRVSIEDSHANVAICAHFVAGSHHSCAADHIEDALES